MKDQQGTAYVLVSTQPDKLILTEEPIGDRAYRHERQQFDVPPPPPAGPSNGGNGAITPLYFNLNERYKHFRVTADPSGDAEVVSDHIYLFHVIVALEWVPSAETLKVLKQAMRGVSDTLYDATNGYMALGQVTFMGPEIADGGTLDRADIQVLASNRFHPRSMIDALNDPKKFFPIRIGRGVWHKNNRWLIKWDEPIAYRAIAHEWAHYALSLRDEYLDEERHVAQRLHRLLDADDLAATDTLVVPTLQLTIDTLMSTLDASELVPLQHRCFEHDHAIIERILNNFITRFPTSGPESVRDKLLRPDHGPYRFPGELPRFQFYNAGPPTGNPPTPEASEEVTLNVDPIELEHCWLYTLTWSAQGTLQRVIAQGTIDSRARTAAEIPGMGQRLLGVRVNADAPTNSYLLAVGHDQQGPKTLYTQLEQKNAPVAGVRDAGSSSVQNPPVVVALPADGDQDWSRVQVRLRWCGGAQPEAGWLALPGGTPYPVSFPDKLAQFGADTLSPALARLDGVVVLRGWARTPEDPPWVCEYSHGGNPPTSVRTPLAPISAGSADGNVMIFSRTDGPVQPDDPVFTTRIVTTRNYAGFATNQPGEPRSYLFSLAANRVLDVNKLKPTVVFYYDAAAATPNYELVIYRYREADDTWEVVPTYLPPGAFFAAAPLNDRTAPSLVAATPMDGLRLEHYRLFAIPRF
ncbi:MAG: hypothetical protein ACLFVO_04645 [Chloroflexaceae bacterium]